MIERPDYNDLPTCSDCGTVQGSGHMLWCPRTGESCDEYYGPSINEQTPHIPTEEYRK